jgi:hypothetical protein
MNGERNENWLNEYREFLGSGSHEVPIEETTRVTLRMKRLLDPNPWLVFVKVLVIHALVGSLSLSICHQFDLNPFQTSRSLADWLMSIGGHGVCMIGCGVFFVGSSVLASGYFLTLEESRALRRTGFPQTFALAGLSLGLFMTVGAELALTFSGLWLLGALIGGFVAAETVWKFKYMRALRMQRI